MDDRAERAALYQAALAQERAFEARQAAPAPERKRARETRSKLERMCAKDGVGSLASYKRRVRARSAFTSSAA